MEVDKQPSQGAGAAAPDTALFSAAVTAAIHGWDPLVVRTMFRVRIHTYTCTILHCLYLLS